MATQRRPWQEELEIVDRTMRTISGISNPEALVEAYWNGVGELLPMENYLAVSRRYVSAPDYVITRSSRFTEHHNPWTQHKRLPRMSGGLLGEIAYANKPVIIQDLPARLSPDDPAYFYLEGYQKLYAVPQYDNGEGINVSMSLMPEGVDIDPSMLPMIHWQASLFGRGTQNLVLRNELAGALAKLDNELKVVGNIQRSLLPSTLPQIPGCELAAHYLTSARAGGDYYDFFPLANGEWGIFIADVSGHGTPAAVLMAITHAIAHAQPGTHTPPMDLLMHLNSHLVRSYTRGGTFVTAFYAVFNPAARTLTYSAAGHNPPRLQRDDNIIALDQTGGLPLGILNDQTYGQATVQLEPGDLLLLYTDGITEAMGPIDESGSRELFGTGRLDEFLLTCGRHLSADDCIKKIRSSVEAFSDDAIPRDDQTLVAVRCLRD
jgi:sigma-B regulation protein RsbU (phosphoserine phosphatase)